MQNNGNWLSRYQYNETSQWGEDGILEKIFNILGVKQGWCAELGAWDGKNLSNTYRLINSCHWSSVLLEGDRRRFAELLKTYQSNPQAYCVLQFVSFDFPHNLDTIFSKYPIPQDFDLLSIDVDGNDLHLWESLRNYQPKIVVIEYNPTIPNHIHFQQPRDMKVNQGSSLSALIALGKKKGYELIATTESNGIFVKESLYPLFNILDNRIDLMRSKSETESTLFQLYDGTLVLEGYKRLYWCKTKIREKRLQVFPRFLRYHSTANPFKKALRFLWRLFYSRKIL